MKLIFNDATHIDIQKFEVSAGMVYFRMINTTPEELITLFQDESKTSVMTVEDNSHRTELDGYSKFYRTEEYTGKMFGVVMCREGATPEERLANAEIKIVENKTNLELAIAELTTLIASIMPMQRKDGE